LRGDLAAVVHDLLLTHYDPVYLQSMRRNFSQFAQALDIAPKDAAPLTWTPLLRS
jgi:tRNA 2-selenouridine synthase